MCLKYIILVLNIALNFTERCSCIDLLYDFVNIKWIVYNIAMVASRVV